MMNVQTVELRDYGPTLLLQTWGDDNHSHGILSGSRFNDTNEILRLMLKYGGACKLKEDALASGKCDCNCMKCRDSIYAELGTKRKWFGNLTTEYCERFPKEGDEWELSMVMKLGRSPRYITFYWQCGRLIEKPIVDIIYESITRIDPTLWDDARLQFVKVQRFDTDETLDCSSAANKILKEKYGVGVGSTPAAEI